MSTGKRNKKFQENRIKNGFGQGKGKDYKPFIQAHDNKVASEGWLTRHLGWKTQRIHHTLSEHERRYLYYLEWLDFVVDIREQYPLLPQGRTEEIAEQLGINHPHVEGESVVMTTDFVITIQTTAGLKNVVRTVKPASKLTKRTLELFEIERRFFAEQGIDWGIISAGTLPNTLISNIEWMYEGRYVSTRPSLDLEMVDLLSEPLLLNINKDENLSSISKLCIKSDNEFGVTSGTCMFILKHMLASKKWSTDLHNKIRESAPLIINNNQVISKENYNNIS
ncbi:TnsA endonuclease N-terminal domain-containing protein [Rossellomorea vietnamensis]|uniref:TnsA endonuclease N-terminal domain-containing protein n=1 Tax=Rossellomorea vietnamensis TaxID=218284 RepID=UPI001CCDC6F9|nr:TnsA endonuclease N-terminal domain-containing protein [Rossellomorea vietnamensis]MCA0151140.1 TnsA endonuclease N-terminal domain-containing protein [Rossellomorea vietnamensis]